MDQTMFTPPAARRTYLTPPSLRQVSLQASREHALDRDVVGLFQTIQALRTGDRSFVLQFAAPHAGAGTTTAARNFAMVSAATCAAPVLLLDAALHDGPGNQEGLGSQDGEPGDHDITPVLLGPANLGMDLGNHFASVIDCPNLYVARLAGAMRADVALSPERVEHCLSRLRESFGIVVIDSAALADLPQTAMLSRYADGIVVVVQSARTTRRQIADFARSIELIGGQLLGAVMNGVQAVSRPRPFGMRPRRR